MNLRIFYVNLAKFCVSFGYSNRYMYRDEEYLRFFRDRSPFVRPTRKADLVMPDQARSVAHQLGLTYYETSVLTHFGVNEVFENAIRAALIARRQQRFWMTNLKKVQRPLLQVS
jgi:Rho-related BTB domain-containing protein 1/2